MILLDGNKLKEAVFTTLSSAPFNKGFTIIASPEEASSIYVKNKIKACEQLGIKVQIIKSKNEHNTFEELLNDLGRDNVLSAPFIIQEPFPLKNYTSYLKSPKNMDHNWGVAFEEHFTLPATVRGISMLLDYYDIPVEGKHIVILGRSNIVGKPCVFHFINRNASVTCLHSKSENVKDICKTADILIVATGKPQMVNDEYINKDTVIIDVGIHKQNGKIVGDVDFDSVKDKCKAITPVPGGVGPATIAGLMLNIADYYNL